MSELAAIGAALQARVTPTSTGVSLHFQRDDEWLTLAARDHPHLELTMRSPDLAGLDVRVVLGSATLLGAEGPDAPRAEDGRWKRTGACGLFDEAPWPLRELPVPFATLRGVATGLLAYLSWGLIDLGGAAGRDPPPRYVLTIADQVATMERRTSEIDHDLAVGAARRLIQVVTRPARQRRELEAEQLARRRRGPYR